MAANEPETIHVVIYDQEYNLRGQLDPEYIRKLARYVDEKMRSVAARTQTVDSLRTAILAAMNIADEYHQMAARFEAGIRQMDSEIGKYASMLDEVLDPKV
ncbi:MAG: cell division protein ZapA [Terriglobia bacterium]